MHPNMKDHYEVADSRLESRHAVGTDRIGIPVAPSHYDRDAVNFDIDEQILDANPSLKPFLMAGDIADKREIDAFLAIPAKAKHTRKKAR